VFLISQDEKRRGNLDYEIFGVCIAAFVAATVLFSLKYTQELFFHHDTLAALLIQALIWLFAVVSLLLFVVYFVLSIINDVSSPAMLGLPQPTPSWWSTYSDLAHRLQIKFVAFLVFSWQNWRRVPFLGRSKSAFVGVPLRFRSDDEQRLLVDDDERPATSLNDDGNDDDNKRTSRRRLLE